MSAALLLEHYALIADAPDAIARLRRFVLDLAVRGKLVDQEPSDEPASELLKRIAAEKTRLILQKAIKKSEVPKIAFEDETPHPVPSNWQWGRLGHIGDWGAGSTPSRGNSDLYGGGMTWLKSGELNDNRALAGSEETVTNAAIQSGSFRLNQPGDVLIAMYGATIGKVAILAEPAVTNQAVCGCTPFTGISNHYLFLFLLSQREQFHGASEGGAQPNISKVKIINTPVPVPPLAEQHRIVAKVDELMALCDQLEAARVSREAERDKLTAASLARLNAPDPETFPADARFVLDNLAPLTTRADQIKHLRQTILNLAARGTLVEQSADDEPASESLQRIKVNAPAGQQRRGKARDTSAGNALEEIPFEAPEGWAFASLGELVRVVNGRAYKQQELLGEGIPVLRVGNLFTSKRWYYSDLALDDDKYCEAGDLIYAWSASFGPFIWNGPRVIYHYHIWKLPLISETDLDKYFLYNFLLQKTREIKDAGHGVSMVHMTKEKMEKLIVPIPPLAEQRRIVAKVDELMDMCDQLEVSLTTGEQIRSRLLESVLHHAFEPA